jgi:hypothetical protein
LLQTRGRVEEGGDLLNATYARFREGFKTAHLQVAAGLLCDFGRAPTQDYLTGPRPLSRSV